MARRSSDGISLAAALLLVGACAQEDARPDGAWSGPGLAEDESGATGGLDSDETDASDDSGDESGESGDVPTAEAGARPDFQLPVPCGQVWTTSTHNSHSSIYKLDLINTNGA